MPLLKAPKKALPILTPAQMGHLLSFKPRGANERRIHTIALCILDFGARIDELLNVRKCDIDFDNFLVTIQKGKGQKQRVLPMSVEMRKRLFRYVSGDSHKGSEYVFTTKVGAVLTQRNALRDLKAVGRQIGQPHLRFHLLRHTFATNYLQSGGNVVLLRRMLGHTNINTTMLYEHLRTDDLKQVHNQHSVVASHR